MKPAFFLLVLLASVLLQPASASDLELVQAGAGDEGKAKASIKELYSDLEAFDISVYSEKAEEGLSLEAFLVRKERGEETLLSNKTFTLDFLPARTRSIRVGLWNVSGNEEGVYLLKARLFQKGKLISSAEYEFIYGRKSLPKFRINDLLANSEGISVVLSPGEPSLFDIEYLLVDKGEVIYLKKLEKASLSELPKSFSASWGTLLENEKDYLARVKFKIYSPKTDFIAYTRAFTAKDNAEITDIFEDESGASATVYGLSQVPFEGTLNFKVFAFEKKSDLSEPAFPEPEILESAQTRVPVLLTGEDETVEVSWSRRLPEGIYRLEIELLGDDGELLERKETIIESTFSPSDSFEASSGKLDPKITETEANKESIPDFLGIRSLIVLLAASLLHFVQKKR